MKYLLFCLLLALCVSACVVRPRLVLETNDPSRLTPRERVMEDSLTNKISRAAQLGWPD